MRMRPITQLKDSVLSKASRPFHGQAQALMTILPGLPGFAGRSKAM